MSQQSDNVLNVQSKNVRFLKNELRFSLAGNREEDRAGQGSNHDEQDRG